MHDSIIFDMDGTLVNFLKPMLASWNLTCKKYGWDKVIEFEELKKEIANVVSTLKEREQAVIKMRFGLENFTKTTLEEIGKNFGVTKECIRQTETRALNKLKNSICWG